MLLKDCLLLFLSSLLLGSSFQFLSGHLRKLLAFMCIVEVVIHLLLKNMVIVLCLYFIPKDGDGIEMSQLTLFFAFCGIIAIFRPHKRNIHNFFDFSFKLVLAIVTVSTS